MSPSEAQLRAALHDGEGDGLNASSLISHALYLRRTRRQRVNTLVGVAAAVLVVGGGTTALVTLGGGSGDESSSTAAKGMAPLNNGAKYSAARTSAGSAATAGRAHRAPLASGRSISSASQASSIDPAVAVARVACPAKAAQFLLPGGGGSGQFGSTGPLFTGTQVNGAQLKGTVAAMKVCVYDGQPVISAVAVAPAAAAIANALEATSSGTRNPACVPNAGILAIATLPILQSGGSVELLGFDANGQPLNPVVLSITCHTIMATNGTAVRHPAALPPQLADAFRAAYRSAARSGQPAASPSR